ncbi:Rrf2 family transcriptional regulator [Microtetraspora sp. NBRC 13810]|uniref:RrF2 family transcriptional regulator n=1 Tax=Microtetraspora sp. NBRC 13810 TaxID=3030990 RepID=UPI0024A0A34C|nr:Rrf2 family transcriptional regulator [Microtetraspora sp. NBRC 13810]GLW12843.1 Rrf2 family transcriptional regulator [Microtetraspora sp. NBRC 13810]
MRISARTQYALRAAAELAAAPPGPVPAEKIAAAQSIPRRFLDNILLQLRRAGLLYSQRGPEGGYWLARPAAEITLADIVVVIEGVPNGPARGDYPGVARPLADVWYALRDHEETLLAEITLAHVASGVLPGRPEPDDPAETRPV